ncbi:sensor histidine kinase, partial [Limnofasciculus baicalensis]
MSIKSLHSVISEKASLETVLIMPILTSASQLFLLLGLVVYLSADNGSEAIFPYVIASIIVTVTTILTASWVLLSINQLKQNNRLLARGEWQEGKEIDRGDKLPELAQLFNTIAIELKELKEENADLKVLLEMAIEHGDIIATEWHNTLDQFYSHYELSRDDRYNHRQKFSETLDQLKTTQNQLIESKKMASLGTLVAGVAHEINTPIGTALMSASFLANETKVFATNWEQGQLKRSQLQEYLDNATESSQLIMNNLQRAGELVQSFKKVAVDQTKADKRSFALKPYLEEVLHNLDPHLKQTKHKLTVEGDDTITIESYPGALSQVVTNLVLNSIIHAYIPGEEGELRFEVRLWSEASKERSLDRSGVIIYYTDNGCGIPTQNLEKIFEPFFTTARSKGGSGLGLHIVYN